MENQAPPTQPIKGSTGLSKIQITILAAAILTLMVVVLVSETRKQRERQTARPETVAPVLASEHRAAIDKELRARRLPSPQLLELNDSGFLVATYEVRGATENSTRAFAEKNLLAIREAMLPYNFVKAYRVTVNGPPPGTGLIKRYGSARFIEGGSIEWESGIR